MPSTPPVIVARVEAASVNRKQGEVVVQLPRPYAELEAGIRKAACRNSHVAECPSAFIWKKPQGALAPYALTAHAPEPWRRAFTELSEAIDRQVQATATDFLRTPEILEFDDDP